MLRSVLIWLLLIHYLLVVGAGLVGRPEPVRQRAAAYVHSPDCQQRHYLQLDCFDHCNGEQYEVRKPGTPQTPMQLLHSLKGLDLHCLAETTPLLALPLFRSPAASSAYVAAAVPVGFYQPLFAPPRRG